MHLIEKSNIHPEIKELSKKIIATRRDFHQNPELGFQEFRTAKIIAKKLRSLGLEVKTGIGQTGVVGILNGKTPGKTIALRADMDALPITEISKVEYKSINQGVMHACGHDGHMAMLLGAAEVLSTKQAWISGMVKFVFQPAEEGGGGAQFMIEDNVLIGVDEIYGGHLWNVIPFGEISAQAGVVLAQAGRFKITVHGKGGHAASPHQTNDAIVAISHLIVQLQTIVSRNTNPLESTVITVGKLKAGTNFNVVAESASLEGTHRSLSKENFVMLKNRMQEIILGIENSFRVIVDFEWSDGYPPTINYPEQTDKVNQIAKNYGYNQNQQVSMWGEDFSYYLQKVPGCFFLIGSALNAEDSKSAPHHSSHFNFDERAMFVGASIFVKLIEQELMQ